MSSVKIAQIVSRYPCLVTEAANTRGTGIPPINHDEPPIPVDKAVLIVIPGEVAHYSPIVMDTVWFLLSAPGTVKVVYRPPRDKM